ncbi:InlB B-repeat-containing protein [Demequina oxidasica]|uniref:InlB B-repeat-containing protein n=1 Tax=Demequina oxidasica TaxID=676199 RepID=UPI000AC7FAB6|nr:InlB B-repeat-containing protein [Demequina oxidasica]
MLKRLTVAACLAAITGAVVTAPVSAAPVETDGGFEFTCDSSGDANITGYVGTDLDITIPNTLETAAAATCDVVSIDQNALKQIELNSVAIPASVTFIGGEAFALNELTSVTFLARTTNLTVYAGAFADQQNSNGEVTGWLDSAGGLLPDIPQSYQAGDTFTAVYTPNYLVTLDYADGNPTNSYRVPENTRLDGTEVTGPLLTGKKFDILFDVAMDPDHPLTGWKTAAGADWDPTTPVTSDITLTAQYGDGSTAPPTADQEWIVTFDPANGAGTSWTTVKNGKPVDELAAPASGDNGESTFLGWFSGAGDLWDFTSAITADTTLTAHWKPPVATKPVPPFIVAPKTITIPDVNLISQESQDLIPMVQTTLTIDVPFDFSDKGTLDLGGDIEPAQTNGGKVSNVWLFGRSRQPLEVGGCAQLPREFVPPKEGEAVDLSQLPQGCLDAIDEATVVAGPMTDTYQDCEPIAHLGAYWAYRGVCVSIRSEPMYLASSTLDATGKATFTFTLPADFPPGQHTLVFSVAGEEVQFPVTVAAVPAAVTTAAAPELAQTGPSEAMMLGNAAAMSIALGLYLVFLGRSRKPGFAGRSSGPGLA